MRAAVRYTWSKTLGATVSTSKKMRVPKKKKKKIQGMTHKHSFLKQGENCVHAVELTFSPHPAESLQTKSHSWVSSIPMNWSQYSSSIIRIPTLTRPPSETAAPHQDTIPDIHLYQTILTMFKVLQTVMAPLGHDRLGHVTQLPRHWI